MKSSLTVAPRYRGTQNITGIKAFFTTTGVNAQRFVKFHMTTFRNGNWVGRMAQLVTREADVGRQVSALAKVRSYGIRTPTVMRASRDAALYVGAAGIGSAQHYGEKFMNLFAGDSSSVSANDVRSDYDSE